MSFRTRSEQALEEIYAEIPQLPACDGRCVQSCGPIAMFAGEWARVTRSLQGRTPRLRSGQLTCPMLSPTGRCTVYSVRPYICRLWGSTHQMRCPYGCTPERWLTTDEAHDIFARIAAIAGPGIDGPLGRGITNLWKTIDLEGREARERLIAERQATVNPIRELS